MQGDTNPQLFIQKLPEWRDSLANVGIDVFAFTMLREPVSWYKSAFNFICLQGTHHCGDVELSYNGLVASASSNSQYSFFVHGWSIPFLEQDESHPPVTAQERSQVRTQLKSNFDWVGTTENFEETMNVLRNRFPQIGPTVVKNKTHTHTQLKKSPDPSHQSHMENISKLDKAFYLDLQKHFVFKGDSTKS